jgi:hypothetical protein
MTPTWAVVLVGVVGGVLASLLTTTLTISHERASAIRPRMLDAADEFSTGTVAALQQARITAGEIKKDTSPIVDANGWFIPDIKSYLDAANNAVDDVLGRQARVHLLFGDRSPAGISAGGVIAHLRDIESALEHRPDSIRDHDEMSRYSRNFNGAREQHEEFNRTARDAFTETWWERLGGRLRVRRP